MKALILSGGKGTRLRPLTFTCAKQLIPVANKPVLGYVFDQVAATPISQVGVITAPDTGEYVREYVKDGSKWNLNIEYIQQEPLGLAHAVKTAQQFLDQDSFVMCLGDNVTGQDLNTFIERFRKENLDALIILKEVDAPSNFGIAELDSKGNIIRLVEKPKEEYEKESDEITKEVVIPPHEVKSESSKKDQKAQTKKKSIFSI